MSFVWRSAVPSRISQRWYANYLPGHQSIAVNQGRMFAVLDQIGKSGRKFKKKISFQGPSGEGSAAGDDSLQPPICVCGSVCAAYFYAPSLTAYRASKTCSSPLAPNLQGNDYSRIHDSISGGAKDSSSTSNNHASRWPVDGCRPQN